MTRRPGNRPVRRLAPTTSMASADLERLAARVRYAGSAIHKLKPGDYGFHPPINPRPDKALCDDRRPVHLKEAKDLLQRGILLGMVSPFPQGGQPKYVWAVDADGEVYEAKCKPEQPGDPYHGYRLGQDEAQMRKYILKEWTERCRTT